MTRHAQGPFEVTLTPMPDDVAGAGLGRLTIDKRFRGDLEAVSKGLMVSASTPVRGSAGYVALERVTGTLHGRRGSFVLQHAGTLTRGAPELSITVVPDSGTDELTGLVGRMSITIEHGKHAYDFAYELMDRVEGAER